MLALTVRRPWASLIIAGRKTIENRSWPPPRSTPAPSRLLIHSGLAWDKAGIEAAPDFTAPPDHAGAIIGAVTLESWHQCTPGCCPPESMAADTPGIWHWVLADPIEFPDPVPATGLLGLWRVAGVTAGRVTDTLHQIGVTA